MEINARKEIKKNKNTIKKEVFLNTDNLAALKAAITENIVENEDGVTIKSYSKTYTDKETNETKPISTSFKTENNKYINNENDFIVEVDDALDASKGVLLNDGFHFISLSPSGKGNIQGVVSEDKSKVVFNNAFNNGNLELVLKENGIQMNLVITNNNADDYTFDFSLTTTNLKVSYSNSLKRVTFLDEETEEKVFEINAPYMFDANSNYSSDIYMFFRSFTQTLHSFSITPKSEWIKNDARELPIVISPKIEKCDFPVMRLTGYMNSIKGTYADDKMYLGIKDGKSFSIVANVLTEQVIAEISKRNLKRFEVFLELHYENGIRPEISKGIEVFCGSTLLSSNALMSTENNILVNLTDVIKNEITKYKKGLKISNLNITFIHKEKVNTGSSVLLENEEKSNVEDDYVVVFDRLFKDSTKAPELHINGTVEGEIAPGTPFMYYKTGKSSNLKMNLYSQNITCTQNLGSIKAKSLNVDLNLLYDSRFLKEQTNKKLQNNFGKGWLLNVCQRLVKNDNYNKILGNKETIYYDGENNPHILSEKWYYEKDNARYYIPKSKVYIGNSQKLKYRDNEGNTYDVQYEASNDEGLILVSTNSRMNYIKKSDLKVHKRYFIRLANNVRYEVFKDDNGLLNIPHAYTEKTASIGNLPEWLFWIESMKLIVKTTYSPYSEMSFVNGKFMNGDKQLSVDILKRQLFLRNGKYYVIGLKNRYEAVLEEGVEEYYDNYNEEGQEIEIEVENEFYIDRNIPLTDYYENDNIAEVNSRIAQCNEQIKSLKQQIESASISLFSAESDLNQQLLLKHDKGNSSKDVEKFNHSIFLLKLQLENQQKSLQKLFEMLNLYETQLTNLKEQKQALVKEQKNGVQDYVMDSSGTILGFDYYGKLIYISDKYENEIFITYDDGRITEVGSNEQKFVFHYNDDMFLDYILDYQGRKKIVKINNGLLVSISSIEEFNEKQEIIFVYSDDKLHKIKDASGIHTIITEDDNMLKSIEQYTICDKISSLEVSKNGHTDICYNSFLRDSKHIIVSDELDTSLQSSYSFDNIGRLIYSKETNSIFDRVSSRSFHYDEKKKLFDVSYKEENSLVEVSMGIGNVTEADKIIEISNTSGTDKISNNHIPSNGLVVAKFDLSALTDDSLSMNELTLKAIVTDKDNKEREYKQVFNDFTTRNLTLPFVLKKTDKKVKLCFNSTKEVNISLMENVNLYKANGSIFEYDENENLIKEINGLEEVTYENFVDKKPTLITIIDKFGNKKEQRQLFNSEGLETYTEDYLCNCKETYYDDKGNVIEEREYNKESPTMVKTNKLTYDENGQVTKVNGIMRDEDGLYPNEEYRYFPKSNKVSSIKHPQGQVINYGYDFNTDDLLEFSSDANGQRNSTKMKYRFGLLTSLSHHDFDIDYELDGLGRKTKITVGGKVLVNYYYEDRCTYNGIHNCYKTVKVNNDGTIAYYTKDNLGRLLSVEYIGELIEYTYNANDELYSVRNGTETITFDRLNDGKIGNKTTESEEVNIEEEYQYFSNDLLEKVTTTLDNNIVIETSYAYDSNYDNRLWRTSVNNGFGQELEYDALNRITASKIIEGSSEVLQNEYTYLQYEENTIDLIKEHIVKLADGTHRTKFKYDVNGNIIEEESDGNKTRYQYDKLNRLVREDNPKLNKTIKYHYDNGGNILSKEEYDYTLENDLYDGKAINFTYRTTGWKDQLINCDGINIYYDTMGRPTKIGSDNLLWDTKGRLIKYGNTTFTYDINGNRRKKNGILYYVTDGKIIREKSQNHDIIFEYSMEKVIGFKYNGDRYFYERNIQGDIVRIYRASDFFLVAEYKYDAWGNHEVINYKDNIIGDLNPFRYRGYYFDKETGLYYLNSRYYSPELCRFISPDELSILDETKAQINGLNLYAYCNNNPVMYADPSGRMPEWLQRLAIALTAIGAILVVGAITALTMGIGTTIMATTMAGAVIHGAAVGTLIGAGVGVVAGGIIGGALTDWSVEGILIGMGIGFGACAILGALIGGSVGAIQYTSAAKSWLHGKEAMIDHFNRHGADVGAKNVIQYTKSAKNIIKSGTYLTEKNAYVSFYQSGKYFFTGVGHESTLITTFGIRTFTKTAAIGFGLL